MIKVIDMTTNIDLAIIPTAKEARMTTQTQIRGFAKMLLQIYAKKISDLITTAMRSGEKNIDLFVSEHELGDLSYLENDTIEKCFQTLFNEFGYNDVTFSYYSDGYRRKTGNKMWVMVHW